MIVRALLEIFDFFNHQKQQKAQVFQIMGLGIILIIIALTSLYAYTSLSTRYNSGSALLMVILALGILATVILIISRKINNASLLSNTLKNIKPLSQTLQTENINRLFQANKKYVPAILAGIGIFGVYKALFSKKIEDVIKKNI